jgi:hypothetical protein
MFTKLLPGATLLILAACANPASAAVPAIECRNCTTAALEEQLALSTPGLGIRFIYNFRLHTIRKFKVHLGNPGNLVLDAIPVEPQPAGSGRVQTPSGVAVRTLYEMSVDPDVVVIFREMDALNTAFPGSAFSKQFRVDITRLGLTYGDVAPRYFDPQRIGWEYPSGEGFRFLERVSEMLGSSSTAPGVDDRLSRLIHGILSPATGAYIEGGSGGGTAGIQFGSIGSEFTVDFCSSDDACTRVKVSVTPNGVKSEYVSSRDKYDVQFPAMSEAAPRRREWGRNGMEYARDMAAFVSQRTGGEYSVQGGPSCSRVVLACSDAGAQWMCVIYCQR